MKKKLLIPLLFIGLAVQAQTYINMAFVGFNADGNDDFAIVTFSDIAPNTTVFFCDSEWNGSSFGTDEGDITWNSGADTIRAGTVISFNNISDNIVGDITASVGTVTGETEIEDSDEGIFAYVASAVRTSPLRFLAAIGNGTEESSFGTLENTQEAHIILLPAGTDIGTYNGPRAGGYNYDFLLKQVNSVWRLQDGDGNQHMDGIIPELPFNTDPFLPDADILPPEVVKVKVHNATTTEILFSEELDPESATSPFHYSFEADDFGIIITRKHSLSYNNESHSVTIIHDPLINGQTYRIWVYNVADKAHNSLQVAIADVFTFNDTRPNLIITEIMYNPPTDAHALEFIEVYNAGADTALLRGLHIIHKNHFDAELRNSKLAPGAFLLLATDATGARAFYNQLFTALPATGNGLSDEGGRLQITNSIGYVIDSVAYDDTEPWPTEPDGFGFSLELSNPLHDHNDAANWRASNIYAGEINLHPVYASPGSLDMILLPSISFLKNYDYIREDGGTIHLGINIKNTNKIESTVEVVVATGGTAQNRTDFVFYEQLLTFPAGATAPLPLHIDIIDNTIPQPARYVILELRNPSNATLAPYQQYILYIVDDEMIAPVSTKELEIEHTSSYTVDQQGSAEIVAYDSASQRLFVINSTGIKLEILDFKNPYNISTVNTIDISSFGIGTTSVAVKNGIVAVTSVQLGYNNGKVLFFTVNGDLLTSVEVGNQPDMVMFSPNGQLVLTADEGQLDEDLSSDPYGSISIIDISGGIETLSQSNVSTLSFSVFESQTWQLQQSGVRFRRFRRATDLEPEYITVSPDSKKAWVTLQENNAIATVDLVNKQIVNIFPLRLKDYRLPFNAFDASDQTDTVFLATWPVHGMYQPDGIACFVKNEIPYLVTANEGDAFANEEVRVQSLTLNPVIFPHANALKKHFMLGRLTVSNITGNIYGDEAFEQLHTFGTRSFSIWNGITGEQVFDSGNDFELITSLHPVYKDLFNASNDNNTYKNRSDNKGPEPEGVTLAEIHDNIYAFITLERVGGIMVYNVTDPVNPVFVDYINSRSINNNAGDLGPEGIIYISPENSPIDTALLVIANEISSTISVFKVKNVIKTITGINNGEEESFTVYPNPTNGSLIYFNKAVNYRLYNTWGLAILEGEKQRLVDVAGLADGIYIIKTDTGVVRKVLLQHK